MNNKDIDLMISWRKDWNKFVREATYIRLDYQQRRILSAIQHNKFVAIRSCNARGKDFLFAGASWCHVLLNAEDANVILTAPTGRQVSTVMMSEIRRWQSQFKIPIDGEVLSNTVKFYDKEGKERGDKYLIGFKATDKDVSAWSGYHTAHTMVCITEAQWIDDETFEGIEGVLTGGNPKLILAFNPLIRAGESYRSTHSEKYKHFKLSGFKSVNFRAKKVLIPGQIDYETIKERIFDERYTQQIQKNEMDESQHDFKFEDNYYRPTDAFRIHILGEYPVEESGVLIPLYWLELSVRRWRDCQGKGKGEKRTGVDVAGMGRDNTVFANAVGNVVESLEIYPNKEKDPTIHMQTAGMVMNKIKLGYDAMIDAAGEGAGVYSRVYEQNKDNVYCVKDGYGAKGLHDVTGIKTFRSMRDYLFWCLRDALDPKNDILLALPPDDILLDELTGIEWTTLSDGKHIIESKDKMKKRHGGKSPDRSDAVKYIFYPRNKKSVKKEFKKEDYGIF